MPRCAAASSRCSRSRSMSAKPSSACVCKPSCGNCRSALLRAPPAQDDDLPPVDTVIYVRDAMDVTPAARASWHEGESIADAVDAARRSDAATLILPFDRPADYQTLCRAMVTVRAMRRPYLR